MAGLDAAGAEVRRLAKLTRRALRGLAAIFWQCCSGRLEYEHFVLT